MEIGIPIQAARDRQQPWLDLTPIGFCYVIDFTSMSQVNRQTQRRRRIQRRLDLAYPLVSGTLPKSQSWPAVGTGTAGGASSSANITPTTPQPPCSCQQCLLVMSVKAAATAASTLSPQGRKGKGSPSLGARNGSPRSSSLAAAAGGTRGSASASAPVLSSAGPLSPRVVKAPAASTGTLSRSGLATLSRPVLQRIAMVQSRALIASGVPTVPVKNLNGSSPVHPALAGKTPEEVVKKYLQKVRNPPEEDGSLQCPTCKTIYGVKTGTQPLGKMEYHTIPHSLPGHPDCRTIRVIYNIPPGIQGPEHTNPGKPFTARGFPRHCYLPDNEKGRKGPEHTNPGKPFTARGFPRHCYLPDNEKGRKVLKMLLVAWDRRLIFTVGVSSTTGESDTVIWNEVHHKTEFGSNLTGHGFPDPNYLDNVLAELSAQGITEESIRE
ncbi:UNVERIFIED_CONTAM: hypothetical protein FKN15_014948 [Acipenser sinensis]